MTEDQFRDTKELIKQESVAWQWIQAPTKTQWGHDMVVADLEIDKDHTVSIYCERDQTVKVEAMFAHPPKREWVGLTLKDMPDDKFGRPEWLDGVNWAEAKLRSKNHVS